MATLRFTCPVTEEEIDTGVEIDTGSFVNLPPFIDLVCPECDAWHSITGVCAWVGGPEFTEH